MWSERYRPKDLKDLVGLEGGAPKSPLLVGLDTIGQRRTIDTHLLFYGKPGTGKTTAAMAIAKAIYGDDTHGWVMELNASDQRGIDIVRGPISAFCDTEALLTSPHQTVYPYKLVILDEADAMTLDAQKGLRHKMESHAASVRFIFMCNFLTQIHKAIRSRCFIFRFPPHSDGKVRHTLERVAAGEGLTIADDGMAALVREAGGDLRHAIHLLQGAWISKGSSGRTGLTSEDVYDALGKPPPALWQSLNTKSLKAVWGTHLSHHLLVDVFYSFCDWLKVSRPPQWLELLPQIASLERRILAEGGSGLPVHRWTFMALLGLVFK